MALNDCVVLTPSEPVDASLAISPTITATTATFGQITIPVLKATWSAPTDPRVIGVQFEYQESGQPATRTAVQGVGLLSWIGTSGLVAGKTYAVRYRAVSATAVGNWSAPANKTLPTQDIGTGVIDQSLTGPEIYALMHMIVGDGDTSVNLDGTHPTYAFWVGSTHAEDAPFRVKWDGTVELHGLKIFLSDGSIGWDSSAGGLTNAGSLNVLRNLRNLVGVPSVSASVTHAANTGAITSVLAAHLGATSPISITGRWRLTNAFSTPTDTFPSSATLKLYSRYKATSGGAFGAWAQVGSDQVFTKDAGGGVTSTEYRVANRTEFEVDDLGGYFGRISYTIYYIDTPAELVFTISAGTLAEGYYEFAIVGGDAAPFDTCSTLITLTDTDDEPSWIVAGLTGAASVPYALTTSDSLALIIDTTGNSTLSVTADRIALSSANGLVYTISPVNLNLDITTTGAGGRDTGSITSDTWYYIFLISTGSTSALLCSTSKTAPTLPSGYSYFGRIGSFRTDGSGNIKDFRKSGKKVRYKNTTNNLPTVASGSHGAVNTPTWQANAVAGHVPPSAVEMTLSVFGTGGIIQVAPNNSYGASSSTTNPPFMMFQSGGSNETHVVDILLESANVYSASSNSACLIRCVGYVEDV